MINPQKRVLVAMSGGVDSSVAACLLQEQGYEVVGIFMGLTHKDGHSGCCSINDRRDAFTIAEQQGFKFMAVNYQEHFDLLKDYFLTEYDNGRTPNPCVRCNSDLKFGQLVHLANQLQCYWIATGHYAQIINQTIHRGIDPQKDQSYVLATINPQILSRLLLPIGGFYKEQIREKARIYQLKVASKPDSQDLCFVKNDYREVLKKYSTLTPGKIVSIAGEILAEHIGYQQYTIGQRKGLNLGKGRPYYVIEIRPSTAEVVVSDRIEDLDRASLELEQIVWHHPIEENSEVEVQIRYRGNTWPGKIQSNNICILNAPARSITPGQLAVFYQGNQVLGGGFIKRALK